MGRLLAALVIYCVLLLAVGAHRRLREQELATANAELQALRAQLDPHFLFNTLHSLTQLAREDPVATQDALQRFGELMRYVIKSGRQAGADVALEQELEFVRNYLALEQLRLGDRLQVIEQIDPDAFELAVPPLLLQPLVENAVRHGLSPRRQGGTLRLSASVADDRLVILVNDNGNGADAARLGESKGLSQSSHSGSLRKVKVVTRNLPARRICQAALQGARQPSVDAGIPKRGTCCSCSPHAYPGQVAS